MRIVYNKLTKRIIAMIQNGSVIGTPTDNSVFEGSPDEFEGFARVIQDKAKGMEIIDLFLSENKLLKINLEQNIVLLTKFMPIKSLLELGDITSAHALTIGLDTDNIFTPERKTRYLLLMAKHLNYI